MKSTRAETGTERGGRWTAGRCLRPMLGTAPLLAAAHPAAAHGFAQPYDLPIPLWLYLGAAGAAVALTFAAMLVLAGAVPGKHGYARVDLLGTRLRRGAAHGLAIGTLQAASVGLFVLIITAGLFGNQSPFKNIAPTLVWVIWWVGIAYVSALIGDVWALINPWRICFTLAEAAWRRVLPGRRLSLDTPYPERLGAWPAVAVFLAFAWTELAWAGGEVPCNLALLAIAYSAVTWTGMVLFGRETWLRHGEAFSLVFGVLARFAPLEVRVESPEMCAACPACAGAAGGCVNCYHCFARARREDRRWNLRPPAVGLLTDGPMTPSMMVFVVLMLSTVTFDGFMETPLWFDLQEAMDKGIGLGLGAAQRGLSGMAPMLFLSAALVAFVALFVCVYALFGRLMAAAAGAGAPSGMEMARLFVLTLVPIALAYHLAHYLSFLLVAGQLVIPLASDPFGIGWNLFHTVHYRVDIGIVGARFVWYTAVTTVVLGHVIAVYLAHVTAVRVLGPGGAASRSQIPMLVLMVGYTMISLWILAQPVVSEP